MDRKMNESSQNVQGGITVFMAITYLTLVVFSFSIVEITRINIAQIQAQRAMISASQSTLGGYDQYLKDQYGLFARSADYSDVAFLNSNVDIPETDFIGKSRDGMTLDYGYYVNNNIMNDPDRLHQSFMDIIFFNTSDEGYFDMMSTELDKLTVSGVTGLVDGSDTALNYVKKDMVNYMNLRVPVLILEPLLEKITAIQKVGKTGTLLEGKSELVSEAEKIQSTYVDLYALIEGIGIDESTGQMSVLSEDKYVKKIATDKDAVLYGNNYLVEETKSSLESNILNVDTAVDAYINNIQNYDAMAGKIEEAYVVYEEADDKLEALEESLDDVKSDINGLKVKKLFYQGLQNDEKADAIEIDISNKEALKEELEDDIEVWEGKKEDSEAKLIEHVNAMNGCYQIAQSGAEAIYSLTGGDDNYLKTNKSVVEKITEIQVGMGDLEKKIDHFIDESEAESELYIDSAYTTSIEDLEGIKQGFDSEEDSNELDEDTNFDALNNLNFMLEEAKNNVEILESIEGEATSILINHEGLISNALRLADLDEKALGEIGEVVEGKEAFIGELEAVLGKDNVNKGLTSTLQSTIYMELAQVIHGYSRAMYFDYSGYASYGEQATEEAKGTRDNFKSVVNNLSFDRIFEDIPPVQVDLLENPPSEVYKARLEGGSNGENIGGQEPDLNYEDSGSEKQFFQQASIMSTLTDIAIDFHEQMFINEYAIGMFCAYPDKGDDEILTLSGYPKSSHAMDTELEYILTGNKDEVSALRTVLVMIFGIRVVCNMIYLLTDTSKRTIIMNLANAIAGWWTLGAGAIIIAALIMLLWASVESSVDILMLINNIEVPLIKFGDAWYTYPDSDMTDLIGLGQTMATKAVNKTIDVVSEETQELISGLGTAVTEEAKSFYSQEVARLYEEGTMINEIRVAQLEAKYSEALDAYMYEQAMGSTGAFSSTDYFEGNTDESALLEEMTSSVDSVLDGQYDINTMITAKYEVLQSYETEIETVKSGKLQALSNELEANVNDFTTETNAKINEMATEGKEMGTAYIKDQADQYLKRQKEDQKLLESKTSSKKDGKKSKVSFADLVPKMSYQDYIRIFMLIKYNDLDQRVCRMLDLIDLNISEGKSSIGDEKVRLSDYVIGIEGKGDFSIKFGKFLLPFAQYRDMTKDKYISFEVRTVNSYE